jgi:hypothetical protein
MLDITRERFITGGTTSRTARAAGRPCSRSPPVLISHRPRTRRGHQRKASGPDPGVTSPGGALDGERITACYPEVVTALEELLGDRSCIVDGEIVALDPLGGRRYSR